MLGSVSTVTSNSTSLPPQVWVDVGGTFTDCFVTDDVSGGGRRRCVKVLSSGRVRARVTKLVSTEQLLIDCSDHDVVAHVKDFWIGADVSSIHGRGSPASIGRISHQSSDGDFVVRLSRENALIQAGDLVEIDPRLEAPVLATRMLLGVPLEEPLPKLDVRLGTTRGTNALLTRSGAHTALLVTRGFGDVLRIGQQDRPDLFALNIRKPNPLAQNVVEVDERLDTKGQVIRPIDEANLYSALLSLRQDGVQSLAICFLHAYVNDVHERVALKLARDAGYVDVSSSSEVAPLIKLGSRAETTTLDAYLNPILHTYVDRVWQQFGGEKSCRLRLMTSNGNLVAPTAFRGRDSILSGPAGGVVALGHVASQSDAGAAIGLDMGGTSTDVSRYDGNVGRRQESFVAGVRVMTPMMDIQTVAAGGGSVCDFIDGRLCVGPASAGADPGPACYGRGGPLTVTDVNLLLGRFPAERFPFPLDKSAAQARLAEIVSACSPNLLRTIKATKRSELGAHADDDLVLAEGFLQIAVTHMAEAVRAISTAQGSDVRAMALVGFGGAAGGHLCRVADALGMKRILDHPDASVLSALGMGLAKVGRIVTRGIYRRLDDSLIADLSSVASELQASAFDQLASEKSSGQQPIFDMQCEVRFVGTESGLAVPMEPIGSMASRFRERYRATFGYDRPDREIEFVSIRCEATLESISASQNRAATTPSVNVPSTTRFVSGGCWMEAVVIDRESLAAGDTLKGPALVASDQSTLLVEPGWHGTVLHDLTIELLPEDRDAGSTTNAVCNQSDLQDDPVLLEVIARRLQGIADSMGEVLRRTAVSVNVKERRDYSCAVFRGDGSLVANAPHVPVHLGAMGHTVRRMIERFPNISPGDCFLSNDPFAGGSHLPDVTVVTPVFCFMSNRPKSLGRRDKSRPDFFVASRAHHAEIGGRTPGSMPPDATSLAEEGVVLRHMALVKDGISHEAELRDLLAGGPFPSRNVTENLADIAAQQAAGVFGASALRELAATYSIETIDGLMGRLLDVAGDGIARWIETLPSSPMSFTDQLDDGSPIAVQIQRIGARLSIDFTGTAPIHPGGFNATPAIVTAATLYVLRCVSGSDLPLCDGVLRQIDLKIPVGMLNPPSHDDPAECAAVVAGNVETSQRIVDVLLGALGTCAASQGTMNNLLIGDETFGYYETIGGGAGATPHGDGASAVHTHMTNTRITDPEVLESRLPVRLHRFCVRRGSGGKGKHNGGDGIIREIEFLRPLTVSLITSRRTQSPYGAAGGQPGKCGLNELIRDGVATTLPHAVTIDVSTADRLIIQTPGGGGWGT